MISHYVDKLDIRHSYYCHLFIKHCCIKSKIYSKTFSSGERNSIFIDLLSLQSCLLYCSKEIKSHHFSLFDCIRKALYGWRESLH